MNELKPCPYCGETKLLFENAELEPQAFVTCRRCGMVGPMRMEEIDAVTAWNALPCALVWTTEAPTQKGQYYWGQAQNGMAMIVEILEVCGELQAFLAGNERECPLSDFYAWAGPIPTPQGDPA